MNNVIYPEECEIKKEVLEDTAIRIHDLHHSIDVKEEMSTNEYQVDQDCETQESVIKPEVLHKAVEKPTSVVRLRRIYEGALVSHRGSKIDLSPSERRFRDLSREQQVYYLNDHDEKHKIWETKQRKDVYNRNRIVKAIKQKDRMKILCFVLLHPNQLLDAKSEFRKNAEYMKRFKEALLSPLFTYVTMAIRLIMLDRQNFVEKAAAFLSGSSGSLKFGIDWNQSINSKQNRDKKELLTLLKSWKLEYLYEHLVAEQVFVHILKIIKRHHIKDLLCHKVTLGTRILFEHNLEEWRTSIGMPLSDILPYQPCDTLSRPSSPMVSRVSSAPPTPHYVPYTVPSSPTSEKIVMLSTILNETPKGAKLTEYYKKFSKFEDEQRTLLIAAVALYFDENDIHLSLPTSYRLENEILQLFPTEKLEFYRTCKRGKIYNKYCNSKKSFKTAVSQHVLPQMQKSVTNSFQQKILVPEQDAESCVKALMYDHLTGSEFENVWQACAQYRLQLIRDEITTSGILEKWPQYKLPSGLRLIDMDFGVLFDTGNKLFTKWKNCREKILQFLYKESNVKDKAIKAVLKTVNEGQLSENCYDASIFWALHGYFVPTHKIVNKDLMGNKNTVKFAIKDSQESFMYIGRTHEQVEEYLIYLKKKKESIQPFILCVGEDVTSIKEIYVYFDGVKFNFTSFLRAVDICLKIFFVFNVHFPIEAVIFWSFIQTNFYEINATKSYSKVHVLLEQLRSEET